MKNRSGLPVSVPPQLCKFNSSILPSLYRYFDKIKDCSIELIGACINFSLRDFKIKKHLSAVAPPT